MKKFTYIALAAAILLAGCERGESRYIDAPTVSVGTEIPAPDESGEIITEGNVPSGSLPIIESGSETEVSATESAETTVTEAPETTAAEASETTEPVTDPAEAESGVEERFDIFGLDISAIDMGYVEDSVFVGDSICLGFSEYRIIPRENVYARGNLGARSFYDYTFYYGEEWEEEISFSEVLSRRAPKYVFFSMGMNDVNVTTEEQFCDNYSEIIGQALAETEAEIYVCAVTPINSKFTTNENINGFNAELEAYISENYPQRVHFVDFGHYLTDSEGLLLEELQSGDGIHLAPLAYYAALWEIGNTVSAGDESTASDSTESEVSDSAEYEASDSN